MHKTFEVIRSVTLLSLLIFSTAAYAQVQEVKLDFGKVSKEELESTFYEKDSSASAVILGDYGNSRFSFNSSTGMKFIYTRHTRIKIYNSKGYDWADVKLALYKSGSSEETVSAIKGYTYNLEDGKVVKEKLKSDAKFSENLDKNWQVKSFTMPNVKEGSIIEYTYSITSDFFFNLRSWDFQHEIPVVWSEYTVKIPEYFIYKQNYQGYEPLCISERFNETGSITVNSTTRTSGWVSQTNHSSGVISYVNICNRWAARDVPALVEEPYMTTIEDYKTRIKFELGSIEIPGSTTQNFTQTWGQIDKELLESDYFGDRIKSTKDIKEKVAALTHGETDSFQKLSKILSFVQQNFKWDGYSSVYTDKTPKQLLEDKSGNSADINLYLVSMLRDAGLKADPVILSTRSHGMLRPGFPMITQFNYVIGAVRIDTSEYLLDATDPFSTVDVLPIRCINGNGRKITESQGEKWVSLLPKITSGDFYIANLTLDPVGKLNGVISESTKYHKAMLKRKDIATKKASNNQDSKEEVLAGHPDHWEINDYELRGMTELHEPLKQDFKVSIPDYFQSAGDLIYINPIVMNRQESNPFKLENRKFPVDFAYPFQETYMLNLTIPEGYTVDELPESIAVALPNDAGTYYYTLKQRGNVIQVVNKIDIKKSTFFGDEYQYLKEFFDMIVAKNAEQIVIKRI